jgi:decaprenylphospho-beta-D-ribofuranose 2-oxidase
MADGEPRSLAGWGATSPTTALVVEPTNEKELASVVEDPGPRGVLARGLGRSYGDVAQNAGGRVAITTGVAGIRWVREGVVAIEAGTSLEHLLRWSVPQGWFTPVSPGTRHVTIGGAIASDIHGKNHHASGSFGAHVSAIRLQLPSNEHVVVGPDADPELFWATVGGMGLTGVILEAEVRLIPIETSRVAVDTERLGDLDAVLAAMEEGDHRYAYSVAWIDLFAKGAALGRSVLTRGDFATRDALPAAAASRALAYDPKVLISAPPVFPSGAVNRLTVTAFNELWFRKAPRRRLGELQSITTFFHPLDAVHAWNRLYGPRGFLQWQPVIPYGREDLLRHVVEELSRLRTPSFLAVLKRFGPANESPMSFPQPGWTLAFDTPVPASGDDLAVLLDDLDHRVAEAGGRVYLAKDSRLVSELVPAMYPRVEEWMSVRRRVDPDGVLQSDLARRLGLL